MFEILAGALSATFVLLLAVALVARLTRETGHEPSGHEPHAAPHDPPAGFLGWAHTRFGALMRSRSVAAAVAVAVAMIVCFLLVGVVPPRTDRGSPELARLLVRAGQAPLAERTMRPLAEANLDDVWLQHDYVMTHFAVPPARRDDKAIHLFYGGVHRTSIGHRRDVAAYALGLFWLVQGEPNVATEWFGQVEDSRLPQLHNTWGMALSMLGDSAEASRHFWREVENGHAVEAATANLAGAALFRRDWAELDRLASDSRTRDVLPEHARRVLLLHHHAGWSYLQRLWESFAASADPTALIVVLLGAVPWLLIVRAWDVFEDEPIALALVTVLSGALTTRGIFAFHDVLAVATAPRTAIWEMPHGLAFWIAQVGLVEEAVKLLPVLLIALSTRHINEPADWVIYGGLSALGFALAENYDYARHLGIGAGFSRTFVTVPLHVTFTGLVAVSIPEARLRGWSATRMFGIAWLVAGTVHGLYDYLIVERGAGFLATCLAIGWAAAFTVWHEQVAMLSPFRHAPATPVARAWGRQLFCYGYGMGVVVLLIYSIRFHPWFALRLLTWHLYSLVGGACLMFFFSSFSVPAGTVESLRRRLRLRHAGAS